MAVRGELATLRAVATQRRLLVRLAASSLLITINWLAFAVAVTHGQVVEVSLGYYMNPLANVLLGIFVLSERLTRLQWSAVALAAAGVTYLTIETGYVPWLALVVATSFSLYGLIRKIAQVEALPGLAVEMMMLTPLAVGYLAWCEAKGVASLAHSGAVVDVLLIFIGPATAIPLFLFAYGARRIPYSTVGLLLYIGPTLQLVCAVLFFRESFERAHLVGFAFIWMALLLYAADGLRRTHEASRTKAR
jgi:chloramphenicol-sensitive protein RarD